MNSLLTPSNLNNHVGSSNLHHQSDIPQKQDPKNIKMHCMTTKAGSERRFEINIHIRHAVRPLLTV